MDLPIVPPVDPMLAKLARSIPSGDGWLFEPKWDGFRCLVFRDRDQLVLMSRNRRPLDRYFPELLDPLRAALPERCVIDGEIVVPDRDGRGLDFDALLQRIHPAASRVTMLSASTPAAYVAFDVLALGDQLLLDTPQAERRTLLEGSVSVTAPSATAPVLVTPASSDRAVAERWFSTFEGAGLDGVIAKPLDAAYQPGTRALVKVKHERPACCVVAGFRIHKDGDGVGSLLLGLYDADGRLHHVGVAASFAAKVRRQLLDELTPLTDGALADHPWREWAEADAHAAGRMPGGGSRWNAGKDLSWVPMRIERVAEVSFGQLESGRFRHGVRFRAWRDDTAPAECRYDQLDVAQPVRFADLFS